MPQRFRQIVAALSAALVPLIVVSGQARLRADVTAPQTHADAVEKKRQEAEKRRAEEDKKREQEAAKRREEESRKREQAIKREQEERARQDRAARRDDDRRRATARPRPGIPPQQTRVVFIGGYLYDPYFGEYPWWPPSIYPHYRIPVFYGRAHVRVLAEPRIAAVYVDGFYAGIVDDFDGVLQPLPLLPGAHTIALYLAGYRTVSKSIYLAPGSTLRLHEQMQLLPPGVVSEPPEALAALPPPPPGTYIPLRTPPQGQPRPPVQQVETQAPGYGVLTLRYEPAIAVVTIDGREWISSEPGELVIHLGVGRHVVTVSVPGRRPFSTEVDIRDGDTPELNVSVPMGGEST